MFIGLSSGKVFYYKKRNMDSRSLVDRGKEHEIVELECAQAHKGDVRCLIYTRIDELDVLITGSADRTIKLWEPKNLKTSSPFQTIIGHDGTVLDMVYLPKVQLLITSSTDFSMRIWRLDKARALLMYPWFVQSQKISEMDSHSSVGTWLNCFDQKSGEKLEVYAGDTEGSLYVFEAMNEWRE